MGKTDTENSGLVIAALTELREMIVDLKREIVTLKTEMLLTRYGVEQVEKKLNKIELDLEMEKNNSMLLDRPGVRVERL